MDDVVRVQHVERVAGVGTKTQRVYRIDSLLAKIIERAAVDVVHDEVRSPIVEGADVIDLDQTVIMDSPHDSGLSEEAVSDITVVGPVVCQHLDSNGYVEAVVMAQPHGRERPGADAPNQPIPPYGVHRYHSRLNSLHAKRVGGQEGSGGPIAESLRFTHEPTESDLCSTCDATRVPAACRRSAQSLIKANRQEAT